jgi:hypothetical protein
MNAHGSETGLRRSAAPIGVRENEGGAQRRHSMDRRRRVEADRSWTVCHVFSGVPACNAGQAMTGLSRSDATRGMPSVNRRGAARLAECLSAPVATASCETAVRLS